MSSKKSFQENLYDCFLDLQRSAVSFYLNPQGKTHLVFLQHAQKILDGIKNKKVRQFSVKILNLEKKTARLPLNNKEVINLADEMLTLGCLLKGGRREGG